MSDDRLCNLARWRNWPAMHALLAASSDEVKEQLLTHRDEYDGRSAIHGCAYYGAPAETVHALLQAGPRGYVNVKHNIGGTPAMAAAWNCHPAVLRQLIDDGADLNIRANDGGTALSLAITKNRLCERGTDNLECINILNVSASSFWNRVR